VTKVGAKSKYLNLIPILFRDCGKEMVVANPPCSAAVVTVVVEIKCVMSEVEWLQQ
jgi:hypothetical protein